MKYFFIVLSISSYFFSFLKAFGVTELSQDEVKDAVIPNSGRAILTTSSTGEGVLDYIFGYARDSIFALMAVIAIGMFLFIGGRLVVARGNPEEMSKAIKSFIYAAVGIFLVAFAWALVKIIAGLQI